jgi:hypothetical protein
MTDVQAEIGVSTGRKTRNEEGGRDEGVLEGQSCRVAESRRAIFH